jgi:hypothetical protein
MPSWHMHPTPIFPLSSRQRCVRRDSNPSASVQFRSSTSYTENSFSTLVAKMIAGYVVGREAVTSEEANDWLAEFCGARRERRVLLLSNSNYHTEAIKVS